MRSRWLLLSARVLTACDCVALSCVCVFLFRVRSGDAAPLRPLHPGSSAPPDAAHAHIAAGMAAHSHAAPAAAAVAAEQPLVIDRSLSSINVEMEAMRAQAFSVDSASSPYAAQGQQYQQLSPEQQQAHAVAVVAVPPAAQAQ